MEMNNDNVYVSPTISYLGEDDPGFEINAVPAVAAAVLVVGAVAISVRYANAFASTRPR